MSFKKDVTNIIFTQPMRNDDKWGQVAWHIMQLVNDKNKDGDPDLPTLSQHTFF